MSDMKNRNRVQYIVPKQLENIKVPEDVINQILDDCEKQSTRTKVVLLGIYNDNTYFSWESEDNPIYASTPIVSFVDKNRKIDILEPMDSMTIKNIARKNGVI